MYVLNLEIFDGKNIDGPPVLVILLETIHILLFVYGEKLLLFSRFDQ